MKKIFHLGLALLISQMAISQKKQLSNEEIWAKGTFASKSISGLRSMKDGKHYSSISTDPVTKVSYILQYEFATGNVTDTILKSSELKLQIPNDMTTVKMDGYSFSDDEQQVLIYNSSESIYRRSTKELNYIFDRKTRKLQNLSDYGKQLFANFSPDGTKIAFVRENNLFIRDVANRNELKVTEDGEWENIINGGADWVYEEEFSIAKAFFWSPDSKSIAYYKFNEAAVKRFSMTTFGEVYTSEYQYKYPKAGETNSTVSLYVYQLEEGLSKKIDVGTETDQYIPRIKWTKDPNVLCIQRLNRQQNQLDYLLADIKANKTTILFTETSNTYLDVDDVFYFLNDKKSFLKLSDKEGYNQFYLYDLSGKLIRKINLGNWDVSNFYGLDEKEQTIYFQAAAVNPMQREIYSVGINGKGIKKLSNKPGTNSAVFSTNCKYYINTYSTANSPALISLNDQTGKEIRILEDNNVLNTRLATYQINKKEFYSIKTSEGVDLNAWMIKPSNFDPAKKYPVFMFLYGGPGSQQVLDSWGGANLMWYQLLAEKGYIVTCVDNRGTGARGSEFKKCTFLQLGNLEIIDQIESAKWLAKQPYVDANRIGIQGWSYGGYMSSLAITKGADYFKMAIAVAPVTNWKYYDSIYTERYLHSPKENSKGYEDNSPINFVDKIKGNYLIIHGTADDNVHFQNSADMISAMIKANKKFESAYYPNKNHSIAGGNTRLHLYTLMTDFVLKNL